MMRALVADLRWQPGEGTPVPPARARLNQVRTTVEVVALNAARVGALALIAETVVRRRPW